MKLKLPRLKPFSPPKEERPSQRYKAVIAYDGTSFSGWQFQDNAITVQEVVEEALTWLEGASVRIHGSSRTDAGVHAKGFVGHFNMTKPIPPANIVRAVNSRLPESVRFMKVTRAKANFNARLDACGKEYRYHIYQASIMPPHLVPYWTYCHKELNLKAMQEGAKYFEGKNDFRSFAATPPDKPLTNTVRTVYSCKVEKRGPKYTITVKGDGFLYKQVRSMAGFLISVGRGAERPEAVKELLDKPILRTARVETAPARGLFLWKVFYRPIAR